MNDNINGENGDNLVHDNMNDASPEHDNNEHDMDEIEYDEMDLTPYEEDDDATLHKKLCAAKVARKRAEEDLKLLCNRIGLLKMEEGKVSYHSHYCHQFMFKNLKSKVNTKLTSSLCAYRSSRRSMRHASVQTRSSRSVSAT